MLDPMPLNPGVRRMASAHLKQPRRQKPKPDNAATANPASASAAATTKGVSVTADAPSRKGRGRKRKSDESAETNEAPTSPEASQKNPKAAKATKRRGKKAADQLTDEAFDDAKGSVRTQVQHRQPAAKGSKGKRRGIKGAAEEPDEAELQLQDDMAAACAASLVDTRHPDSGAQSAAKAKRVSDIELENQLAMAMASTAAEAEHRAQRKPTAKAVHDEPMPSALSPRSGGPKPTLGETWARDARLANQDLAQSSAASCWAEVFCGSAELGKWVHVDPLLNWLDVPDKVEGAGIR